MKSKLLLNRIQQAALISATILCAVTNASSSCTVTSPCPDQHSWPPCLDGSGCIPGAGGPAGGVAGGCTTCSLSAPKSAPGLSVWWVSLPDSSLRIEDLPL